MSRKQNQPSSLPRQIRPQLPDASVSTAPEHHWRCARSCRAPGIVSCVAFTAAEAKTKAWREIGNEPRHVMKYTFHGREFAHEGNRNHNKILFKL